MEAPVETAVPVWVLKEETVTNHPEFGSGELLFSIKLTRQKRRV